MLGWPDLQPGVRITGFAACATLLFFDQRHRLDAKKMLRDIAERCNERYEAQWDELREALQSSNSARTGPYTKYLNLCAEEYLYYVLGLLHPLVWNSWAAGMKALFDEHEPLREFASEELSDGSYYGFTLTAVGVRHERAT